MPRLNGIAPTAPRGAKTEKSAPRVPCGPRGLHALIAAQTKSILQRLADSGNSISCKDLQKWVIVELAANDYGHLHVPSPVDLVEWVSIAHPDLLQAIKPPRWRRWLGWTGAEAMPSVAMVGHPDEQATLDDELARVTAEINRMEAERRARAAYKPAQAATPSSPPPSTPPAPPAPPAASEPAQAATGPTRCGCRFKDRQPPIPVLVVLADRYQELREEVENGGGDDAGGGDPVTEALRAAVDPTDDDEREARLIRYAMLQARAAKLRTAAQIARIHNPNHVSDFRPVWSRGVDPRPLWPMARDAAAKAGNGGVA